MKRSRPVPHPGRLPAPPPPAASPAAPAASEATAPRPPAERPLDGSGQPYITLAQFLKREQVAEGGGAAKHLVRGGTIAVNGTAETRPGRKLHEGDRVTWPGGSRTVQLQQSTHEPPPSP